MPRMRKYRKRIPRKRVARRVFRRRKAGRNTVAVSKPLKPVALSYFCTSDYTEINHSMAWHIYTPAVPWFKLFVWKLNSLFEPGRLNGAGCPYVFPPIGVPNLDVLYSRSCTYSSKIKLSLVNNTASAQPKNLRAILLPLSLSQSSRIMAGAWNPLPNELEGFPFTKSRYIGPMDGGKNEVYMTNKITVKKVNGVNKIKNDFDNYSQVYKTQDPSDLNLWLLCVYDIEGPNAGDIGDDTLLMRVDITYYTEFFDRKDLLMTYIV